MNVKKMNVTKWMWAVVITLAVQSAACSLFNNSDTPTSPSPTTPTIFSGTLEPKGSNVFTFTVANAGAVNVTLLNIGSPVAVGLGVGAPTGSTCTLSASTSSATAGTTPQISQNVNPGSYCVAIFDAGNLTVPLTFTITVAHS